LLVAHIPPVCSLLAPCERGASTQEGDQFISLRTLSDAANRTGSITARRPLIDLLSAVDEDVPQWIPERPDCQTSGGLHRPATIGASGTATCATPLPLASGASLDVSSQSELDQIVCGRCRCKFDGWCWCQWS